MPQTLTPVIDKSDRGEGDNDFLSLFVTATDTELEYFNGGDLELYVQNDSGGVLTVTLNSVPDQFGRLGDVVLTIQDTKMGRYSFHSPVGFNASTGLASVTLSTIAGTVGVALVRQTKQ